MPAHDLLPSAPLVRVLDSINFADDVERAESIGVSLDVLRKLRMREHIQFNRADRIATRMGLHLLHMYSFEEYTNGMEAKRERIREYKRKKYRERVL